jgi:hypothetical protein
MAAKKRTCTRCGQSFPLTPKHWYLYEGRTPIHRACEIRRSTEQKKAARAKKRQPDQAS